MFMSRRKLKFGYQDLNVFDARGLESPLSEGDEAPKGQQIIDINDERLALEIDIRRRRASRLFCITSMKTAIPRMSDAVYPEWCNTLQQSDLASVTRHLDATHSLHMALMIAPVPTELSDEFLGVHGPWMQVRSAFREARPTRSSLRITEPHWMRRFGSLVPSDSSKVLKPC